MPFTALNRKLRVSDGAAIAPPVASQPEDGRKVRMPGDEGVWIFVIADMCAFAVFFLLFMVGRWTAPDMYEQSRLLLDARLGLLNSLILVTSGLFMARAVHYARMGKRRDTLRALILALSVGLGFMVTKVIEYKEKIEGGIARLANICNQKMSQRLTLTLTAPAVATMR